VDFLQNVIIVYHDVAWARLVLVLVCVVALCPELRFVIVVAILFLLLFRLFLRRGFLLRRAFGAGGSGSVAHGR